MQEERCEQFGTSAETGAMTQMEKHSAFQCSRLCGNYGEQKGNQDRGFRGAISARAAILIWAGLHAEVVPDGGNSGEMGLAIGDW